jgi:pimeloyl-ACP methyl ester carboxylesterase/DNA-binding SARP family transcriptional activator
MVAAAQRLPQCGEQTLGSSSTTLGSSSTTLGSPVHGYRAAVSVQVRLMGEFSVQLDGRVVDEHQFGRRSAASLVKLLALQPSRRMHREQVMDSLWPEVRLPDAANQLHKAAHYARRAVGADDCVSLRNEMVTLFGNRDLTVDVYAFDTSASAALASGEPQAIESALAAWTGDLLPDDPYAPWAFQPRQRATLLHRELLRRAGRWADLVTVDPTDEEAHLGVAQRLLSKGDRAGALRQIDVIEQTLRDELGIGLSPEGYDLRIQALDTPVNAPEPVQPRAPRHAGLAQQTVRFCRTADGVRLAYATSGNGPPLVKASNWLTHLDYDWASPVWSHWWNALSDGQTLVRYDERGCGLSDWSVDATSFNLEAWVHDLETVVDTLGLERFPLLGMSQGGPIALTYAARHPERVSHLVIFGTCASGTWRRAGAAERRSLVALGELIRLSWGSDQPGFMQVYDAKFLPDGPLDLWRAFDTLQRRSTSAENAYQLWRAFGYLDATEAARNLDVPTLILHCRRDQVWSFTEAEALNALVPGSRLVALDSSNHILQAAEPAFATFVQEVREFVRS